MKKGDLVNTPRFLKVRICEVYQDMSRAFDEGFREPTHYNDPGYAILGKHTGTNQMIFAAVKK